MAQEHLKCRSEQISKCRGLALATLLVKTFVAAYQALVVGARDPLAGQQQHLLQIGQALAVLNCLCKLWQTEQDLLQQQRVHHIISAVAVEAKIPKKTKIQVLTVLSWSHATARSKSWRIESKRLDLHEFLSSGLAAAGIESKF
ncbi:hypothetical protein GUJ93_ZPchr0002g24347 [Zizania palustris]|uniref:Uncharacterized protein n=1 Tax=Zizania palustris TaxID=103762 RepID=A0A8J5RN34_ZIZPA|nr:hypothetical protein GUJ93_ZPchr0002g24347 [Zizania palustris]